MSWKRGLLLLVPAGGDVCFGFGTTEEPANSHLFANDMIEHAADELREDLLDGEVDLYLLAGQACQHVVILLAILDLFHQSDSFTFDDLACSQWLSGDDKAIDIAGVNSGRADNETVRKRIPSRHLNGAFPFQCLFVVIVLSVRSGFVLNEHDYRHTTSKCCV
jgi:hypothetical protein